MLGDFWRQRSAGRKGTSLSGLEGFALHLAQTPQDRRIEIPECRGLDAIGEHAREEPSWKMGGSESVQDYEAMRRRIGLYNFSSQYQQRPIPISGNLVKREWLRFYDPKGDIPRFLRIVQSWDTASKTSELNDYSVCTTWGCAGETFYLMDVLRKRLNYPDLGRISEAYDGGCSPCCCFSRRTPRWFLRLRPLAIRPVGGLRAAGGNDRPRRAMRPWPNPHPAARCSPDGAGP